MRLDEALKNNAIEIVKRHKDSCVDPLCPVSVHMIAILLDRAGIKLSIEEQKHFI